MLLLGRLLLGRLLGGGGLSRGLLGLGGLLLSWLWGGGGGGLCRRRARLRSLLFLGGLLPCFRVLRVGCLLLGGLGGGVAGDRVVGAPGGDAYGGKTHRQGQVEPAPAFLFGKAFSVHAMHIPFGVEYRCLAVPLVWAKGKGIMQEHGKRPAKSPASLH